MRRVRVPALSLLIAALVLPAAAARAQDAVTVVSAAGYGNFHAGGVVVTVGGDANRNAAAALEWRPAGGSFRAGHPLTRTDATHFVGSLFWLSPGTTYEARVTLADPDGVTGSPSAVATVQTRADALPEPTLRTLHVSPSGSDLNPGTDPGAPLRTIQRAADLAQSGDLVLIQPGVYRESVTVRRSGTAAQPIVFRGAAAGAILDGADAAIAAGVPWAAGTGGIYSYVTGFPTGHVVSEAGRLYRYASLADLQTLGAGAPGGFHFDGTRLHVKFADGSAPASHTLHAARLEDGFVVDGFAFIRIENLEIRHYGAFDYGKGVYLRYASDCTVRACRIHEVQAAGVWAKGGDRHLVEDNEIWDTSIFGWPWPFSKGSSAENNAVVLTDAVGRGMVVRRNTIHGTFNGVGPCGSAAPASGVTSETDVYDNVLYEHTDDALEPEGYCANVRIWGNRIRDVHMAVAAAPAAPGPLYVVRNVAWRIGNTRTSQTDGYMASALKINSGYPTPVGPLYLYHNTFLTDAPGTEAIALLNPGSSTFIRARNNVIAGTRYALYKVNPVAWDGDGNDLYTTDPSRLVYWQGARYDTLAAYRTLGQEAQGLSAPPQLASPEGGDFEPAPGSPLVDRGIPLPGIDDGYLGAAPDIGAIETDGLPGLSVSDVTVTEGQAGPVTARFTVTLSAPSGTSVSVGWATADGTARSADGDYVAASGSLDFPPGTLQRTLDVTVSGDTTIEPSETFFVRLQNPVNAALRDGEGQGTIVDDDLPRSDFNGDGRPDLLWRHQATGDLVAWFMNGTVKIGGAAFTPPRVDPAWSVVGIGDFNGDGKPDILWQYPATGDLVVWLMNGTTRVSGQALTPARVAPGWRVAGVADLDQDGRPDIVFHHQSTGDLVAWLMNGTVKKGGAALAPSRADPAWRVAGLADLDADGRPDILWQHSSLGDLVAWFMNGTARKGGVALTPARAGPGWRAAALADLNDDGRPDIVWSQETTGDLVAWFMNGTVKTGGAALTPPRADPAWRIVPR